MLVNNCFVVWIFYSICKLIERKTKYENVMLTVGENEKKRKKERKETLMQHKNRCPV